MRLHLLRSFVEPVALQLSIRHVHDRSILRSKHLLPVTSQPFPQVALEVNDLHLALHFVGVLVLHPSRVKVDSVDQLDAADILCNHIVLDLLWNLVNRFTEL